MKQTVIMLLTSTYIAAWPVWILGAVCRIGTEALLAIMGIGYAAWIGRYYLEWRWNRAKKEIHNRHRHDGLRI